MSGSVNDKKLFIGGLSWSTTSETLRAAFEKYGKVEEAKVISDGSGKSRGFGAVTFANESDALAAYKGMHGVELDGRHLYVDRFRDGHERDARAYARYYGSSSGGGAPYEGGRRGPSESAPYHGKEPYDNRDYDSRGSYDRGGAAYPEARGYPEPAGGYSGYGGRGQSSSGGYGGLPPPRGSYGSGRGGYGGYGYPGRGSGGPAPPPYSGRGGFGYDPYGPPPPRGGGGYDSRADYYGESSGYGRGRGGYGSAPPHSAYGRRSAPYDLPPPRNYAGPGRPYDGAGGRYASYDERDARERDHFRPSSYDERDRSYEGFERPRSYDDRDRERERSDAALGSRSNGHQPHEDRSRDMRAAGFDDRHARPSDRDVRSAGYADERDRASWDTESRGWDHGAKEHNRERERDRDRERERDLRGVTRSSFDHRDSEVRERREDTSSSYAADKYGYGREKESSAYAASTSSASRGYSRDREAKRD